MDCKISYEQLSGEIPQELARHIEECDRCRHRLEALQNVDAALVKMPRLEPSDLARLKIRRALSKEIYGPAAPEIMTLEEVGEFLRISYEELREIAGELPAFELAGQIRVRRAKLLEWIDQRERKFMVSTMESDISRSRSGLFGKEVA
jgi:hypothetical protein